MNGGSVDSGMRAWQYKFILAPLMPERLAISPHFFYTTRMTPLALPHSVRIAPLPAYLSEPSQQGRQCDIISSNKSWRSLSVLWPVVVSPWRKGPNEFHLVFVTQSVDTSRI